MHKVPPSARALFADLQRARESLKQRIRRAMGTWPECQRLARLLNNSKPRATGGESLDLALSFCRVHLVAERLTLRPGRSTHLIYSAAGQGKQTERERIATQSTNVFAAACVTHPHESFSEHYFYWAPVGECLELYRCPYNFNVKHDNVLQKDPTVPKAHSTCLCDFFIFFFRVCLKYSQLQVYIFCYLFLSTHTEKSIDRQIIKMQIQVIFVNKKL